MSEQYKKLVKAAAINHLATGLTTCSHTGPATPAFDAIDILKENGVDPSAFVWVHAQAGKDKSAHQKAALMKSWVSLDGIGWGDFENYADLIINLKDAVLLNRVLISHDAGWYKPDERNSDFMGYTNIFTKLFPVLKYRGLDDNDCKELLEKNPWEAFAVGVKKYI